MLLLYALCHALGVEMKCLLAGVDDTAVLHLLVMSQVGRGFHSAEIDFGEDEISASEDDDQRPDDPHEQIERFLFALTITVRHDVVLAPRHTPGIFVFEPVTEKPMFTYFKQEKYSNIGFAIINPSSPTASKDMMGLDSTALSPSCNDFNSFNIPYFGGFVKV